MMVHIKLFAMIREIAGTSAITLEIPVGSTVSAMLEAVYHIFPAVRPYHKYLRVAVNREYVPFTQLLHENDEIALIPPVSGG